jgi:transcriptional antiterminator RfaH
MTKDSILPCTDWFLIHCKSRQEPRALANLLEQGYICYLPTLNTGSFTTIGRASTNKSEQVLFPGYMFVRLSSDSNWHSLRCTRGVLRVVGFDNRPYPVSNELIEQIKERCDRARTPEPGSKVQVRIGLNTGIDAIFLASDGAERAVLLLRLLNQECRLTVSNTSVRPVHPA